MIEILALRARTARSNITYAKQKCNAVWPRIFCAFKSVKPSWRHNRATRFRPFCAATCRSVLWFSSRDVMENPWTSALRRSSIRSCLARLNTSRTERSWEGRGGAEVVGTAGLLINSDGYDDEDISSQSTTVCALPHAIELTFPTLRSTCVRARSAS